MQERKGHEKCYTLNIMEYRKYLHFLDPFFIYTKKSGKFHYRE